MPEWQFIEIIFCGFWLLVFLVWAMYKTKLGPFGLLVFVQFFIIFFIIWHLPEDMRKQVLDDFTPKEKL